MTQMPGSIAAELGRAAGSLGNSGCLTPRLDAEVLLAHVLGVDRCFLVREATREIGPEELGAFGALVRRRTAREPVAYLTGRKEFWSFPVRVDSRALIPRPESETLIEEAAELFTAGQPATFADIGCGSGCLAVALGVLFSHSAGIACDMDPQALALARQNIAAAGFAERVDTRQGDLLDPLAGRRVDLICANMPYVPTRDLATLAPEVRDFEPACALDGGSDGLEQIGRLIAAAPDALTPGGWLLLEVGAGQFAEVVGLCEQAGLEGLHGRCDLRGIQRVVAARRGEC